MNNKINIVFISFLLILCMAEIYLIVSIHSTIVTNIETLKTIGHEMDKTKEMMDKNKELIDKAEQRMCDLKLIRCRD